jgi:hypothetical protein
MRVEDLAKLSVNQLASIRNKNLVFFNVLTILDLGVFYHSLVHEKWFILFLTFGVFVASLALFDNYRIAQHVLEQQKT